MDHIGRRKTSRPGALLRGLELVQLPSASLAFAFPMMLPSFILAQVYGEKRMCAVFAATLALALLVGVPGCVSLKRRQSAFRARDGLFQVACTWLALIVWGALPFIFSDADISVVGSFFESTSGFTTTGASVLDDVDVLPRSLFFWRSTSYWIGGMGIILLTVALLPLFGAGGFQLVKAETPGPEKDKFTPKMTETAKTLWLLYCALTLLAFALLKLGGMSVFDAVCHAFNVAATGGFSVRTAGLASFNSPYFENITIIFMFLSAINYNLYYRMLRGNFREVFYNSELRGYLAIFITAAALITINITPLYGSLSEALHTAVFHTASFMATCGATISDYTAWPPFSQTVLLFLMITGGCSGSAAGGVKIIRCIVLCKQAGSEMRRLIHPRGVFSVQLNHRPGRKDVVYGVAGFIFVYMAVVLFATLATSMAGFDIITSLSASLATTANLGAALGVLSPDRNFSMFSEGIQVVHIFAMLAGRLEFWTILVLFQRDYWKAPI